MKPKKQRDKRFEEYLRRVIITPVKETIPWSKHEKSYYQKIIRRPVS